MSPARQYRSSFSIGEMGALEVLRVVALPVVARVTSLSQECIGFHAANKLKKRGYVTITEEDEYRYVRLTELGEDFLKETFGDA